METSQKTLDNPERDVIIQLSKEKEITIMMTVQNVAAYAKNYKYIVARHVDGQLWFWGAWNDRNKANDVAEELGNGVVVINE